MISLFVLFYLQILGYFWNWLSLQLTFSDFHKKNLSSYLINWRTFIHCRTWNYFRMYKTIIMKKVGVKYLAGPGLEQEDPLRQLQPIKKKKIYIKDSKTDVLTFLHSCTSSLVSGSTCQLQNLKRWDVLTSTSGAVLLLVGGVSGFGAILR